MIIVARLCYVAVHSKHRLSFRIMVGGSTTSQYGRSLVNGIAGKGEQKILLLLLALGCRDELMSEHIQQSLCPERVATTSRQQQQW